MCCDLGATCVITFLVPPWRYPIGCPKFTADRQIQPEPTGPNWLPHGRMALMAGVRNYTVPRDCTTKPLFSGRLGLQYEYEQAHV